MNILAYTHPSFLARLGHPEIRSRIGSVLVELAPEPALTVALGLDTPNAFLGLAAYGNGTAGLDDLKVDLPNLPAPIVLAPGRRLSPQSLAVGVAKLAADPAGADATLLVHVEDALAFRTALARATGAIVLWDLADPPGEALPALLEYLRDEECLPPGSVAGLHVYTGEGRAAVPGLESELRAAFGG